MSVLCRSRTGHDRREAARRELDVDAVERTDFGFPFAVHLAGVDGAGGDGVVAVPDSCFRLRVSVSAISCPLRTVAR